MVLKQLFFQKITKNRPAAGSFTPRPHSLQQLGALPTDPVCDTLELQLQYTSLLKHVTDIFDSDIFTF